MEISDLTGLRKPLTRLIEVIASGVGEVSQPYLIRRRAAAEADAIREVGAAVADVAQDNGVSAIYRNDSLEIWQKPEDRTLTGEERNIDDRLSRRGNYQERKRQSNVENVTSVAAMELSKVDSVPDEMPDADWVTRFFGNAHDVSSTEMQDLWGRILAGEIERPGRFSLRTLDFVRNVTKSEAELFMQVAGLALTARDDGFSFIDWRNKQWLKDNRNIYDAVLHELGELGLVYPSTLTLKLFDNENVTEEFFLKGGHIVLAKRGAINGRISLPIWKFTATGKELLHLASTDIDGEYLECFASVFNGNGGQTQLCRIVERHDDGSISYELVRPLVESGESN